ncbi:MAG TPA: hypothetical protein VII13_05355 [Vicinamibacteria bacterium]|jgi:hypothetical protein
MSLRYPAVCLAATLAVACGGGAPQQQAAPPPTQAAAAAPAPAAAAGEFGVAECDDYVNKYIACIDSKVPEASRTMVRQQLDLTRSQWKQAPATPEGKAAMAAGCKAATDAARTAMAAYGCTF